MSLAQAGGSQAVGMACELPARSSRELCAGRPGDGLKLVTTGGHAVPCTVLNLWVTNNENTPCVSDIYMTMHNSSRISYEVATKAILWLGVTTTRGTVLKGLGIRKVENHC